MNNVASTIPGTVKTMGKPLATSHAPSAEHQDEQQARDDGRDGKGQVDQGDDPCLAAPVELGDRPGRRNAEGRVQRHGDCAYQQRQPDRRLRIRFRQGSDRKSPAAPQRLVEHRDQGREQQDGQHREAERDQRPLHDRRLCRRPAKRAGAGGDGQGIGHDVLRYTAPMRRRLQIWIRLMARSSAKEIASIAMAMATAPS